MKDDNVHDFFHNVSRLTIILPIIIIGMAIILKPRTNVVTQSKSITYSISPTNIPPITGVRSQTHTPINLKGPLICSVNSQSDYKGMVYIKNKKVRASLISAVDGATMYAVLNGDCLYKWQEGTKTGVKLCGLSQYVAILDTMANFGALDAQTLMSMVSQFGSANGATNMPKEAPDTKCEKNQVADTEFDIPKVINFQVKTATPSAINK